MQHCHTDQIEDQCRQQCAADIAEHRFFVDIEIQVKILSVAVHPEIAAGIRPVAGVGQRIGRTGFADALHQRAVGGIQPNKAWVVCGDHLVVLHNKYRAADVLRVAVQHALDGQVCALHKLRQGHPVSQQHGIPRCGTAGGNIHRPTVLQQNALDISLLRVLQHVQCGALSQRFRKLRIADITICIFAQ